MTPQPERWFGPAGSKAIRPLTWQGRLAYRIYLVLVLFAVLVYSSWALIATVVAIYTLILSAVIFVKSDLADQLRERTEGP